MAKPADDQDGKHSVKRARVRKVDPSFERGGAASTQVRTLVFVLVCFLLGIAVGAYWYHRAANPNVADVETTGISLSDSTKAALKALDSPVEIRFYSMLDAATTSDSLRNFAGRVDQLLSEYQREAAGKIKVLRHNSQSDSDMDAAASDGLRAFNLDKGDACFLGVAIVCSGQKETLGQLSPEWEAALESDLTRAILSVIGAQSVAGRIAATAQADAAAAEDVKRSLPNFASVSVEQGRQMLRDAAMKELKAAMNDFEIQIKEVRQRLSPAQSNNSEAEQQAALKQLQQSQAQQAEKFKEIAARLQAQIAALERLKSQ